MTGNDRGDVNCQSRFLYDKSDWPAVLQCRRFVMPLGRYGLGCAVQDFLADLDRKAEVWRRAG